MKTALYYDKRLFLSLDIPSYVGSKWPIIYQALAYNLDILGYLGSKWPILSQKLVCSHDISGYLGSWPLGWDISPSIQCCTTLLKCVIKLFLKHSVQKAKMPSCLEITIYLHLNKCSILLTYKIKLCRTWYNYASFHTRILHSGKESYTEILLQRYSTGSTHSLIYTLPEFCLKITILHLQK